MAVALITGASRGFGRALARSLALDGWSLVLDARGAPALELVTTELAELTEVRGIAGDVTDAWHRERLVAEAEALGGLDLLVNNASVLGPSPQPALAGVPARRAAIRVRGERRRAARARAARAAPAARVARHDREHHLRRGPRAVRRLGRLRIVEGRARAVGQHPRRRRAGRARVHVRSGRHAHADAPRGVPRRGHLRSSGARGRRAVVRGACSVERPGRAAGYAASELVR